MIREWTPGQWALRLAIAVGPLVALLATVPAGVTPRPVLVGLVVVASLVHARLPESSVGVVSIGLVIVWWGVAFRDGPHAWAVLAAAGLLAAHVAALLAAYGPDGLGVDAATVRLWLVRAGVAFLLAPAIWLLAVLVRDRAEPPGVWVAGLVAALVATLAASLALNRKKAK